MSEAATLTDEGIERILAGQDKLYTPVEVAQILNLQKETIQGMCRDGRLEATKMNSIWRITGAEIARYIRSGPRPKRDKDSEGEAR